jgi:hypothetical protein
MTREYIYEEMTWAQTMDAWDFVFRFEITERHFKGAVKLSDWLYKGRDMLPDMMRKMIDSLRGKGGS